MNKLEIKTQDAHISGSSVTIETPKFFLGTNEAFVSGADDNIRISGSNIDIQTPKFYFGEGQTGIDAISKVFWEGSSKSD